MTEVSKNEKLNVCAKKKVGTTQIKNSVVINAPENTRITKVLAFSALPVVEHTNVNNAEIKFDGYVKYNALMCLDNGEFLPVSTSTGFNCVVENAIITQDCIADISFATLDSVSNDTEGSEIAYNTTINFDVSVVMKNNNLKPVSASEDLHVKESDVEVNSYLGGGTHNSILNVEIKKDAKTNNILFCKCDGIVKSVVPSVDYFTVSGDVVLTTINVGEDGQIKSQVQELSFSEEIEGKGVTKDSIIQSKFIVQKDAVITKNDESGVFNIEIPFGLNSAIYGQEKVNCVVDAYSTTREINLTTESFEQNEFFSTKYIEEQVIANFSLSDNMNKIEKILATIPVNISVVNTYTKNGEIVVEGVASFSLVYYSEDEEGNNVLNSVLVEVPYSLSVLASDVHEGDEIAVNLSFGDINVKSKKGKELDIIVGIRVNYDISRGFVSAVATSVTYGDEKIMKDYALEIYVAKENQTLWDIAKELNISTDNLLAQNAELTLPISVGEKIVAYHQREEKFGWV